jgi:hypothetical protein
MAIPTEEQNFADEIESGATDGNNGRDALESMQLYVNPLSNQERTSTHPRNEQEGREPSGISDTGMVVQGQADFLGKGSRLVSYPDLRRLTRMKEKSKSQRWNLECAPNGKGRLQTN